MSKKPEPSSVPGAAAVACSAVVRPTGIANTINKFLGGASPEPDDCRNNNPDFLAGYAVGMTYDKKNGLHPITEEWRDRGEPNGTDRLFKEWKRGYWAGVFHRIEGRSWSNNRI